MAVLSTMQWRTRYTVNIILAINKIADHSTFFFLQDGVYSDLGTLVAMGFVQGGGPMRLFGPSVYSYMCGMSPSDIIVGVDEVPDTSVQDVLKKVRCVCVFLIHT